MKEFFLQTFILIIILNMSAAPQENFTLILLPDTQYDAAFYPSSFNSQTQWIVDNKTAKNIIFVTHVGDIVDIASSSGQWHNADAAMDKLDVGNVAYSVGLR